MAEEINLYTINSRKLDNSIHRSWKAKLLQKEESLLLFYGEFEKEVKHEHLGVIRRGTASYEFYWLDGWYNVFRFHEPSGDLRNFYCNLNMPPILENNVLDYVDLDIDILVWKDFSYSILDLDEFAENTEKFRYSKELREKVDSSLKELILKIEKKEFPFNLVI